MLKIENKILPEEKQIWNSLTCLHGIGKSTANKIVKECNINPEIKTKELNQTQINSIIQVVKKYTIEERLREIVQKNILNKKEMGTYQGDRHKRKLPLHGQRTRHNAKTAKKGGTGASKDWFNY